jgi:hypothetical protein
MSKEFESPVACELHEQSLALCNFEGLARTLNRHGFQISRDCLIQNFRDAGDVQHDLTLFTAEALDRGIGSNYELNAHNHGITVSIFHQAFLHSSGVVEVFDRYNLTKEQREAVLKDLSKDVPLSVEEVKALLHDLRTGEEPKLEDMCLLEDVLEFLIAEIETLSASVTVQQGQIESGKSPTDDEIILDLVVVHTSRIVQRVSVE